jgi:hypothetical protein
MYRPDGERGWEGDFLVNRSVVILRQVQSNRRMTSARPPLKVLLAISEPESGRGSIRADEMRQILERHNDADPQRVRLLTADNLSFSQLKEAIGEFQPEVFHFHGHGDAHGGVFLPRLQRVRFNERRTRPGVGAFSAEIVDEGVGTGGGTFASLFSAHRPELVLFTACETALSDVPYGDVARQLANEGVPAVVAMQFRVTVEAAELFAERFYEALVAGENIEPAFAAGLEKLTDTAADGSGTFVSRWFGTPVLFLNADGGALLERRAPEPPATGGRALGADAPAEPAAASCVFCGAVGAGTSWKYCGACGRAATCQGKDELGAPCGFRFVGDTRYCPNCGTLLESAPLPAGSGAWGVAGGSRFSPPARHSGRRAGRDAPPAGGEKDEQPTVYESSEAPGGAG